MSEAAATYESNRRIRWFRPKIDRGELTALSRRSNFRGFIQAIGHLGLWGMTGTLAYVAFRHVSTSNWLWTVPLLYLALFAHGSVGGFMGGASCHELAHRTVFKTRALNDFFLAIFAFFSWWNHIWFRPSHIKHHQHTTFHGHDGEVVLPQELGIKQWQFLAELFAWNPLNTWRVIKENWHRAMGRMDNEWYAFCLPESNRVLRRQHQNRARRLLAGHVLLAVIFIVTGHWFLIFIVNFGTQYCVLLTGLCGMPQHFGMQPDVADHRLCCRTYITRGLPAFLYWNMQYHAEHHMFPSVPFFNLPKLRKAIEHEMPPATRGLWETWAHMLEVRRKQQADPSWFYVPELPEQTAGEQASDLELEREASGAVA